VARRPYKLFPVSSPEDRVQYIERQVRRALYGPELPDMRKLVIQGMLANCPDRDDWCDVVSVYEWWKSNLRYIPDPVGVDLYPTPMASLDIGGEDCDGHVVAVNSSLALIGFDVGVRVIQSAEGDWHVYSLVGMPRGVNEEWVPLDTTWPDVLGPGHEYPTRKCRYNKSWVLELR
jgi:hypothetical protein